MSNFNFLENIPGLTIIVLGLHIRNIYPYASAAVDDSDGGILSKKHSSAAAGNIVIVSISRPSFALPSLLFCFTT